MLLPLRVQTLKLVQLLSLVRKVALPIAAIAP
nr:MAG TPA: hypothetical protein [Bacteriophage sp.]DAT87660.1 MAG TPA: hypothetical protein [Caudoviricetes sp.]